MDRGIRQVDGQTAAKEADKEDKKGTYSSISKEDERHLYTLRGANSLPVLVAPGNGGLGKAGWQTFRREAEAGLALKKKGYPSIPQIASSTV